MKYPLSSADISIFHKKLAIFVNFGKKYKNHISRLNFFIVFTLIYSLKSVFGHVTKIW